MQKGGNSPLLMEAAAAAALTDQSTRKQRSRGMMGGNKGKRNWERGGQIGSNI